MGETGGYRAFRQRLDQVLRRRDAGALREFLVAEGQWDAEARTDVEAAMWMMIATSPALADMRDEARRWLLEHGHAAEAAALFGRQGAGDSGQRGGRPPRHASTGASHQQGGAAHPSGREQAHGSRSPSKRPGGRRPPSPGHRPDSPSRRGR